MKSTRLYPIFMSLYRYTLTSFALNTVLLIREVNIKYVLDTRYSHRTGSDILVAQSLGQYLLSLML